MVETVSLSIIKSPVASGASTCSPTATIMAGRSRATPEGVLRRINGRTTSFCGFGRKAGYSFPSVYISQSLGNSTFAKLYVHNRVQEAMRVAELPQRPHTIPVYVYCRQLFRDQSSTFLSQVRHFICSTNDSKERLKSDSELLGPVSDEPGQHRERDCSHGSFSCAHVGLQH